VDFVERRYAFSSPEAKLREVRPWIAAFREAGADGIVLGCTHFLLLLDEFREAAGEAPAPMAVFDSVLGVSRRVEALLDEGGGELRAPAASVGNKPHLVITGDTPREPYWATLAETFDLQLGAL
jgi:glutamate racemase